VHFLNLYVVEHDLGYVSGADGGYQLDTNTVRQPDAGFIAKNRVEDLSGVTFSVAPDLAVEVISPSEIPSVIRKKIDEYLTAGTKQVWTIYPDDKVIDIWQLADDGSKNVRTVDVNGTLDDGDILPGFTLEAKRVFPE
jgi:Uma2 family endonuclease